VPGVSGAVSGAASGAASGAWSRPESRTSASPPAPLRWLDWSGHEIKE
jgi:hypothetical protein